MEGHPHHICSVCRMITQMLQLSWVKQRRAIKGCQCHMSCRELTCAWIEISPQTRICINGQVAPCVDISDMQRFAAELLSLRPPFPLSTSEYTCTSLRNYPGKYIDLPRSYLESVDPPCGLCCGTTCVPEASSREHHLASSSRANC